MDCRIHRVSSAAPLAGLTSLLAFFMTLGAATDSSFVSQLLVCFFESGYRCRKRVNLYDRPAADDNRVLLGTGLVWRLSPPQCSDADVELVTQRMPAVEVYGVVPSAGQEHADYPFKTLLYESTSYQHQKKVHFADFAPSTMREACGVGPGSAPLMRLFLWHALYIR